MKVQFGGVHEGWMGERSVPITSAEGCWSAKSLWGRLEGGMDWGRGGVLRGPESCSCADVENLLGGFDGGEMQSVVVNEVHHVVADRWPVSQ